METNQKARRQINVTKDLPRQNAYTLALNGEFSEIAFDESRAPAFKGQWKSQVFKVDQKVPMDLEVGTGAGHHFAWFAKNNPDRCLIGVELKYKPLIQSIRRAVTNGSKNVAICRYHAFNIDELFLPGELDNVFVHFPDPWTSPKKPRNRFVSLENLELLWGLQKPGSIIDFKTDSRVYFDWSLEEIAASKYEVVGQSFDLHNSEFNEGNFQTGFEKLFMKQKIPINFIRLLRK